MKSSLDQYAQIKIQKEINEDISDCLARQKQKGIRKEVSQILEKLK